MFNRSWYLDDPWNQGWVSDRVRQQKDLCEVDAMLLLTSEPDFEFWQKVQNDFVAAELQALLSQLKTK